MEFLCEIFGAIFVELFGEAFEKTFIAPLFLFVDEFFRKIFVSRTGKQKTQNHRIVPSDSLVTSLDINSTDASLDTEDTEKILADTEVKLTEINT